MPNDLPDTWYPKFNGDHVLSPTGNEPVEERWTMWNDLDFDFHDYQRAYFFWLGAPDNEYLKGELHAAEAMISWSTCYEFRTQTRALKSFAQPFPAKPECPQTLRFATEVGYGRAVVDNPMVKLVDESRSLWEPPVQIFLHAPEKPPKRVEGFLKRVSEAKETAKAAKKNRARSSKPRIAARR